MNFNPSQQYRRSLGLKFLVIPIAYIFLVRGFKVYWLQNDLRYLYKDILKPYHKRIDDNQCIDYRDLKDEFENNKVDEEKSLVLRLQKTVESKMNEGKSVNVKVKDHTNTNESSTDQIHDARTKTEVNVNMIKRF
ncbi:UNKNOWN [Stylonychia lemnae]|uniref:Uncharacterized protein n=1 Tax=Stylonychia lemnae TaxID=5949 RepID=A0A077ZNW7_STYLE|nr:UNKNOWN [Stylonychia lemnae]|eukprot:CDW71608.1 UNKNOWN [Stylonychia lemnae]